jgi:hypothetical protein
MSAVEWSQWLDFDRANVEAVPESPGVCVMHASMKVLYIGAGQNVRQELLGRLLDPCTSKAKRFKYLVTPEFEAIKEQQVNEYVGKHGRQPPCMEKNQL